MSQACVIPATAGAVRAMLASVDCNTRDLGERGYTAIAGSPMFQLALTQVLVIYVALVGYRLLFAPEGARLSDGARMALKVGAVLALVSSWTVFQTLAFDLADRAPREIARMISDGGRDAQPDPVGRLQVVFDQLSASASAFGAAATQHPNQTSPTAIPPAPGATNTTSAADAEQADALARRQTAGRALGAAGAAVLLVDAGLIAVSTLMIGVLGAVGPVFVVLLIFRQTRGFFEGWVRALAAAALISMSVWVLDMLMTAVLQPWLIALAQARQTRQLDPGPAMTAASITLVFTTAQVALAVLCAVVAFGFRLAWDRPLLTAGSPAAPRSPDEDPLAPRTLVSRPALLADQLRRFDGALEGRARAVGIAASVSRAEAAAPAASGSTYVISDDGYRRPTLGRDPEGRRGAFR
jgi:type IV secretion system protein VirB6